VSKIESEEIDQICPCLTERYENVGDVVEGTDIGIKYMNLTAVLIEAIKEQQKMIDKLTAQIELLESKK
jgi:hypothetical protein